VSGAGKVALHAVEKLIALEAVPFTISGMFCVERLEPCIMCYAVLKLGILYSKEVLLS